MTCSLQTGEGDLFLLPFDVSDLDERELEVEDDLEDLEEDEGDEDEDEVLELEEEDGDEERERLDDLSLFRLLMLRAMIDFD